MKKLLIVCFMWWNLAGLAYGQTGLPLPEILEPLSPDMPVTEQEDGRPAKRFGCQGKITGFKPGVLFINYKIYFVDSEVSYWAGNGKELRKSSFRIGDSVGCVLNTEGIILELWEIPKD
jgi:hypothetical protein